jgi:hypothetical protein
MQNVVLSVVIIVSKLCIHKVYITSPNYILLINMILIYFIQHKTPKMRIVTDNKCSLFNLQMNIRKFFALYIVKNLL